MRFSGQSHDGAVALVKGAMATIPLKRVAVRGQVGVFSSSDQVAGPLPGLARPAFSYLLLGALRGWGDDNGDKVVTANEAQRYTDGVLVAMVRDRDQRAHYLGSDVALSRGARERGPDIAALRIGDTGDAPVKAPVTRRPLGVQVQGEDDAIRVIGVTADSPAAVAGLSVGDRIVQLNGQPATLPVLGGAVKADRVRIAWVHGSTRYDVDVSLVGDRPKAASAPVSITPVAAPIVAVPVPKASSPAQTAQTAEARCLSGDVTTCRVAIEEANGDPKRQLMLTAHACQIGDNQVCITAGALLADKGAPKEALPLLELACKRDRDSCIVLSLALISKSMDDRRGVKILEDNCKAGSLANCGALGAVLIQGVPSAPQDVDRGLRLITRACDGDHGWSCDKLGDAYRLVQPSLATATYKKACRLGQTDACAKGDE
jgi:PDZ domain